MLLNRTVASSNKKLLSIYFSFSCLFIEPKLSVLSKRLNGCQADIFSSGDMCIRYVFSSEGSVFSLVFFSSLNITPFRTTEDQAVSGRSSSYCFIGLFRQDGVSFSSLMASSKGRVSFVLSIHFRAEHSDNTCKGPGSCYILDYYPKLEGLTFFSHSLNYLPLLTQPY